METCIVHGESAQIYFIYAFTCSKSTIETLEKCEICSKLTIKTPEQRQ